MRNSVSARCHKVLATRRCIEKAQENKKDKPADTLVKLRELFDQDRKVQNCINSAECVGRESFLTTHPAKLTRRKGKVASLTPDLEGKELAIPKFLELVENARRLSEEAKRARTEASKFDYPLQSLQGAAD